MTVLRIQDALLHHVLMNITNQDCYCSVILSGAKNPRVAIRDSSLRSE
jgi:hypothetical protein